MADWWRMSEDELAVDAEARQEKCLAYYNVFYATPIGRQVLFDILNRTHAKVPGRSSDASLTLVELYHYLRASAGIDEEIVIEAEAKSINFGLGG